MSPVVSLALLLLPFEARPLGGIVLNVVESRIVAWWWSRRGAARLAVSRVGIIGLIILVLATLRGLAYASPPDPSWIPGLYDDADYDDVVMLVTSTTANVGPDLHVDVRPILRAVSRALADPVEIEYSRPASDVFARAPPAV
jgi:hypothetical protein